MVQEGGEIGLNNVVDIMIKLIMPSWCFKNDENPIKLFWKLDSQPAFLVQKSRLGFDERDVRVMNRVRVVVVHLRKKKQLLSHSFVSLLAPWKCLLPSEWTNQIAKDV